MARQTRLRKLGFSLLLAVSAMTLAFPTNARDGAQDLDSAVERVRRETGGRVISATTDQENGNRVHNIRVLTPDGHVRRVRVPAGGGDSSSGRRRGR